MIETSVSCEDDHLRRQLLAHKAITGNSGDGPDGHARVEFTCGLCCVFAAALHDITGWQIVAEFEGDDVAHAWVVNDDGRAVDVNGIHESAWARTPYSGEIHGVISSYPRSACVNPATGSEVDYAWAMDIIDTHAILYGVTGYILRPHP